MSAATQRWQFEDICVQREGSFLLFLFVSSYAFVTNFFIQLLSQSSSGTCW